MRCATALAVPVRCYLGPSPAISSQFSLEMCAATRNCKKISKTPILGVQGRSRSSMLTNLKSLIMRVQGHSRS